MLECMGWEAVIIDECQRPRISTHYAEYRMLVTDLMLLLFSGPMKVRFLISFRLNFVSLYAVCLPIIFFFFTYLLIEILLDFAGDCNGVCESAVIS